MRRSFLAIVAIFLVLLLVFFIGPRGAKIPPNISEALEKGKQFELLSLDPGRQQDKPKDDFHHWKVLGKLQVGDAGTRGKLVTELKRGVFWHNGTVAMCFNPRHGIRVNHEGRVVDLVICFECRQVQVYRGDERASDFLVSWSPQPVFDQTLREAGVPLPKPVKE